MAHSNLALEGNNLAVAIGDERVAHFSTPVTNAYTPVPPSTLMHLPIDVVSLKAVLLTLVSRPGVTALELAHSLGRHGDAVVIDLLQVRTHCFC
jgi:hypothetical protein